MQSNHMLKVLLFSGNRGSKVNESLHQRNREKCKKEKSHLETEFTAYRGSKSSYESIDALSMYCYDMALFRSFAADLVRFLYRKFVL